MNIRFLILLFIWIFAFAVKQTQAQSKSAYLQAGEECMERNDPFCAINNFRLALDYGEDADVYMHLGQAEKTLHNYREALHWYRKCLAKSNKEDARIIAFIYCADLCKRLGDFTGAASYIDELIILDKANKSRWEKTKLDYGIAEKIYHDSIAVEVIPASGDINTAYSDFAPAPVGDSILFFSSLRYFLFENNQKSATSRIASHSIRQALPKKSKLLDDAINQAAFNNANASVSPDGKIMVFTRCVYDDNNKLICSLYESQFINGIWQDAVKLPSLINPPGRTSTQPCISTDKSEGYLLFFSSNRTGGNGGMDIWFCRRSAAGKYDPPKNLGEKVNSAGDEWTPFYDAEADSIYFSTEKDEGPGGLDLFITSFPARENTNPRCLPSPMNSPYNDLYFTRSYGNEVKQYMVSNRPPALRLNGSSCCYDIFSIHAIPPTVDSLLTMENKEAIVMDTTRKFIQLNTDEKLAHIRKNFPLRLYFDNDQPDPRSTLSSTDKSYDKLVGDYLARQDQYVIRQGDLNSKDLITGFFNDSVDANFQRLEAFTEWLYQTLYSQQEGIKITIQGSASPLAERRYNLILSARRIESLMNYWFQWKNGLMKDMLQKDKLNILFIPAGEEQAPSNISDKLSEQEKSVYSIQAALERRIELVDISLLK